MLISRSVCCLVLLATCSPLLAVETPLIWKFQVGDEHHYRMTQNMDMEMSFGATDRKIETGMQQVLDMTWKIEQVDDQGQAAVTQSVDRVQMDMQAPGQQEMHYDTDSDDAPAGFAAMLVPLYKAMTAEPFGMTMSSRGEIKDLKMSEALIKSMKAVPGAAMLGEMFSDEGFKNMMQQSSLILPKPEDLEPGYEWTTNTEMKNPQFGVLKIEATYRYLGPREVEGKPFEVFSIAMNMDFGEAPGGMQMEITGQESHGEILFSREDGRLESSKMQQHTEMSISAASQEMTQTIDQTVILEHVEKQPAEQE